jgi:hypothetical protein
MGVKIIKSTDLPLRLCLLSSCFVKFTAMIPHRKFCSLSFVKHFEALLFSFFFAICSFPHYLYLLEKINCSVLLYDPRKVERNMVGRNISIYVFYSFCLCMLRSSVHLISYQSMSYHFKSRLKFLSSNKWKDYSYTLC